MDIAFRASRYGKGGDDYVNCPMTKEQYDAFYDALSTAEKAPVREFENMRCFEGCMPIETMAERGRETLAHGPMKPVGITDPKTGGRPYAVVQLRAEDAERTAYNIVGFQTRLKWPEQARVFRMIPGLQNVKFIRYGSLHRNTFINGPLFLEPTLEMKGRPGLFFAGQVSGVEGYVESSAMGILAGINAARLIKGLALVTPPETTAHGALITHLTKTEPGRFQPTNVIFSLFPPLDVKVKKKEERRELLVKRALSGSGSVEEQPGLIPGGLQMFEELDELKKHLDSLRPIDADKMAAMQEKLKIDWTYNSNAIEGNKLSLQEKAFFLREGLT